MASAKDNIFNRILSSTKKSSSQATVELSEMSDFPKPLRTALENKAELIKQLKINAVQVEEINATELDNTLDKFFQKRPELPRQIISNLELNLQSQYFSLKTGRATGDEKVGLSRATLAIAATGTLVLQSSITNPTSINYLVDHHIVLLAFDNIVSDLHQAMGVLNQQASFDARAINFISGPSRTADIEQTIQLGAHGPRNLLVLIVN